MSGATESNARTNAATTNLQIRSADYIVFLPLSSRLGYPCGQTEPRGTGPRIRRSEPNPVFPGDIRQSSTTYRTGGRVPQANVHENAGQRAWFYLALGLVTAATLMLQIIETRIISVISWYHLAFFIISIAMFGLTAGAVFVYLRRARFRPKELYADLTVATLAFALTTNLAILVQLT